MVKLALLGPGWPLIKFWGLVICVCAHDSKIQLIMYQSVHIRACCNRPCTGASVCMLQSCTSLCDCVHAPGCNHVLIRMQSYAGTYICVHTACNHVPAVVCDCVHTACNHVPAVVCDCVHTACNHVPTVVCDCVHAAIMYRDILLRVP